MKYEILRAPHVNANDLSMVIVKWEVKSSEFVKKGSEICIVETTKTTLGIESPCEGYIHKMAQVGDHVKVGEPIAYFFDDYDIKKIKEVLDSNKSSKVTISKKAKLLMNEYGLTVDDFKQNAIISSDTVVAKIRESGSINNNLISSSYENIDNVDINLSTVAIYCEPNLSLLVVDACKDGDILLLVDNDQHDVIDNVNCIHVNSLQKLIKKGLKKIFIQKEGVLFYDSVLQIAKSNNIEFSNIIHQTAKVSRLSVLGVNIFIGSNVTIGPKVSVGDSSKILSSSSIAHHSNIDSDVTIADGCCIGGNVIVGKGSNLGLSVTVNKRIDIGKNSMIVSGVVVIDHVKDNSILRLK